MPCAEFEWNFFLRNWSSAFAVSTFIGNRKVRALSSYWYDKFDGRPNPTTFDFADLWTFKHTYFPIIFWAVHEYSPPSSSLTFVMLTWLITSSWIVTYCPTKNLELSGICSCMHVGCRRTHKHRCNQKYRTNWHKKKRKKMWKVKIKCLNHDI